MDDETLFELIARLAERDGVAPLNRLPGLWERRLDARWVIWVNGHNCPTTLSGGGPEVPPYHCYVEFNGWPAGLFSPFGGTIAAGRLANEATFVEALRSGLQS